MAEDDGVIIKRGFGYSIKKIGDKYLVTRGDEVICECDSEEEALIIFNRRTRRLRQLKRQMTIVDERER